MRLWPERILCQCPVCMGTAPVMVRQASAADRERKRLHAQAMIWLQETVHLLGPEQSNTPLSIEICEADESLHLQKILGYALNILRDHPIGRMIHDKINQAVDQ